MTRRLPLVSMLIVVGCGGIVQITPSDSKDSGVQDSLAIGDAVDRCRETHDKLRVEVREPGGVAICAPGGTPVTLSYTGTLVAVATTSITVDTCPPWADCAPRSIGILIDGDGVDLSSLPKGAYVEVDVAFQSGSFCTTSLLVRSVATWGGVKNPAGTGDRIFFAGADGHTESRAKDVFTVEPVALGCKTGSPCGAPSDPVDDYALRFKDAVTGEVATISMGTSGTLMLAGVAVTAYDLRSYESGVCDDYWNFAWYVSAK